MWHQYCSSWQASIAALIVERSSFLQIHADWAFDPSFQNQKQILPYRLDSIYLFRLLNLLVGCIEYSRLDLVLLLKIG